MHILKSVPSFETEFQYQTNIDLQQYFEHNPDKSEVPHIFGLYGLEPYAETLTFYKCAGVGAHMDKNKLYF